MILKERSLIRSSTKLSSQYRNPNKKTIELRLSSQQAGKSEIAFSGQQKLASLRSELLVSSSGLAIRFILISIDISEAWGVRVLGC